MGFQDTKSPSDKKGRLIGFVQKLVWKKKKSGNAAKHPSNEETQLGSSADSKQEGKLTSKTMRFIYATVVVVLILILGPVLVVLGASLTPFILAIATIYIMVAVVQDDNFFDDDC